MDPMLTRAVMGNAQASGLRRVEYVLWSRMQAEAGQDLATIVGRKEVERRAGQGVFCWGVGNAPSILINALARTRTEVPVVFSIMKGRPRAVDLAPTRTVVWRRFIDSDGVERDLPKSAVVTSRGDGGRGPKQFHYALMCASRQPLELAYGTPFDVSAHRNAGGTGAPVGASQVTALLRRVDARGGMEGYEVNLRATLTDGYWVRLTDPADVSVGLAAALADAAILSVAEWLDLARQFRELPSRAPVRGDPLLI